MKPLQVLFFGNVILSAKLLGVIEQKENVKIACIVTKSSSEVNSDHVNLSTIKLKDKPVVLFADQMCESELFRTLSQMQFDLGFCIGWSSIISKDIFCLPKLGIIGYHPALLPKNRGRHPLIWALCLGLRETGSTFFMLDRAPDSGDIVSQIRVPISKDDFANSLYERITKIAKGQLDNILSDLNRTGQLNKTKQQLTDGNIWRKRTRKDGIIDWRMGSENIYNLIRALTSPYPFAEVEYCNLFIKLRWAELGPELPSNIEPGFVFKRENQKLTIKCGTGSIILSATDFDTLLDTAIIEGTYL